MSAAMCARAVGPIVVLFALIALSSAADLDDLDAFPSTKPTPKEGETKEPHVPSSHAVEVHHSLHRPLDQSQVYWNFGGATVLTRKSVRLTPATQNRRGWLWNDYPIEAKNWEIEFSIDIFSKPHFGGDGMAFWLLEGAQDPTFHADPQWLSGDLVGIRKDFKGLGVVFDVYDNDGRRDNPSIFVLYNPSGTAKEYNHDNDFADDMYKRVAPGRSSSYSCVAQLRNTGSLTKVLLKFIDNVLHGYVDTNDGVGYKFCFALEFEGDNPFRNHHIAFTGMTGQVADVHEVVELSTRYLESGAKGFVDDMMAQANEYARCSTLHHLFCFAMSGANMLLVWLTFDTMNKFKRKVADNINPQVIREEINTDLFRYHLVFAAVSVALVMLPTAFLLNLPLVLWKAYQYFTKSHTLTLASFGGDKVHGSRAFSFPTRQMIATLLHVLVCGYSLLSWANCL